MEREKEELIRELAALETANDHLVAELKHIDELLRATGFSHGLDSLKEVAHEMLEQPPD